VRALVLRALARAGADPGGRDVDPMIEALKSRARTVNQLAERVAVRLNPGRASLEPKAKVLIEKMGPAFATSLGAAGAALQAVPASGWNPDVILERLKEQSDGSGIKLGDLMQPIRVALTGDTVSEPVNELLYVVGRDQALARIEEVRGSGLAAWSEPAPARE
jgi:glutamyl-tRNA synthetase